ncbi:MAG: hypothetical protein ACE5LC_10110 [Candidatus Aminicenantales bacterium]
MARCGHCQKRKGKRNCPALGIELCNLCCGILRQKEIHCPPHCSFLVKHKAYQERRIVEKKAKSFSREEFAEEDILKDERMAWLAVHIEAPIKFQAEKNPAFKDKDALLALEYARERVEKRERVLFLPGEKTGPKNPVGEAICEAMDNCKYEERIIITGETQAYKREEKLKCLERVIQSVKFFSRGEFEGRRYIEDLLRRFKRIDELSLQKKVITTP